MGTLVSTKGDVWFKPRPISPDHNATANSPLLAGNRLWTEEKATATIDLPNVGVVTLSELSLIELPKYSPCGAILLKGEIEIKGEPKDRSAAKCFLHTPSGSFQASFPGAVARISVDEKGVTEIQSKKGTFALVELSGTPTMLQESKETTIDKPYLENEDTILDKAEQITNRLGLDVEILIELMGDNKNLMSKRKAFKEKKNEAEYEETTNQLTEQAAQMVALQKLGLLQANRAHSLVLFASSFANDEAPQSERITRVIKRLDEIKEKLPQLFAQ